MTAEEAFIVTLGCRQIGIARGTDISAVGGENVEVGVGVRRAIHGALEDVLSGLRQFNLLPINRIASRRRFKVPLSVTVPLPQYNLRAALSLQQ